MTDNLRPEDQLHIKDVAYHTPAEMCRQCDWIRANRTPSPKLELPHEVREAMRCAGNLTPLNPCRHKLCVKVLAAFIRRIAGESV